ncbi:MAG: hypothetical protein QF692_02640 [Alphaproteobacteria bacterium]|jgi:hypothetical protein|nr:hypothetical protein [Alphaproteobacteria bacterium]MDP7222142.1 hypothetical protein [Alphaproteobacteria bacterium]
MILGRNHLDDFLNAPAVGEGQTSALAFTNAAEGTSRDTASAQHAATHQTEATVQYTGGMQI